MTLASRPASPGTNVPSRNRSAPLELYLLAQATFPNHGRSRRIPVGPRSPPHPLVVEHRVLDLVHPAELAVPQGALTAWRSRCPDRRRRTAGHRQPLTTQVVRIDVVPTMNRLTSGSLRKDCSTSTSISVASRSNRAPIRIGQGLPRLCGLRDPATGGIVPRGSGHALEADREVLHRSSNWCSHRALGLGEWWA